MRVSNVGAYTIRIYKCVSTFMLFLPRKHKRVFMLFLVSARNTNAFLSHSFSQTSNSLKQLEPFRFFDLQRSVSVHGVSKTVQGKIPICLSGIPCHAQPPWPCAARYCTNRSAAQRLRQCQGAGLAPTGAENG